MNPLSKFSAILILDGWNHDLIVAATDVFPPVVVLALDQCRASLRLPTPTTRAMRDDAVAKALRAMHEYRDSEARRWCDRALALDLVISGALQPTDTRDTVKTEAEAPASEDTV